MGYYYWRHRQHVYMPCIDDQTRLDGFWLQDYPVSLHNWGKNATTMRRYHDIIYNGADCSFKECGGYQPKIHDYLPEFWTHMQVYNEHVLRTNFAEYVEDHQPSLEVEIKTEAAALHSS